jgi:uncharacterized protein YdeI (YjbR/CyaY-like superfamily)
LPETDAEGRTLGLKWMMFQERARPQSFRVLCGRGETKRTARAQSIDHLIVGVRKLKPPARPTNKANPKIDDFIANAKKWREELKKLRSIALDSELTEELKWGQPCYTFQGKNIAVLNGLKESCAFAFFKGVLLKDVHGVLTRPGQHSQSTRWIKFTSVREIAEMKTVLKAYIREAIEIENAGLKVKLKKTSDLKVPDELQIMLDEFPDFKTAFEALTPGRQRAYIYHFSAPKQSKTRESRVLKFMPHILKGKGLMDE